MRVLYCVGDEKKQQTDNIIGWCCVRGNMDNNGKYIELRSRYLRFVYKAYHWSVEDAGLRVWFDFEMGDVEFHPTALVERKCLDALEQANTQTINDIVFNIGMVELVSYWKCACPPEVEVQCGTLTDEQRDFWLKLYWNGLGEFYYTNGINESREEFMRVRRVESGEWRVESGERRVESGEWRAESGEWRVESGEWRVESGEWRVESGERRAESGEWRVENGEWRVESGEWRVESGERRVESGEWRVESGEWRVESGEGRVERLIWCRLVGGRTVW